MSATAATLLRRPELPAPAQRGAGLAALLLLGGAAASFAGFASAIELAFPVAALAAGVGLLRRGRHVAFVELTLWVWLFAAGLRRMVDYGSVFHAQSPILATPYLLALVALPVAFAQRQRVHWTIRVTFLLAFAVLAYGVAVGLLLNGVTATFASFLNWFPPVALGFFVLMTPAPWSALQPMFVRFATWALLLLGVYGVVQWIAAPGWDTAWLQNIGTAGQSFGQPKAYAIRIWSFSNSPGTLAGTLVWLLVSQIAARRRPASRLAVVAGAVALAISAVRAAWIGLLLALVLIAWRGRLRVLRTLAIAGTAVVLLLLFGGPIAGQVTSRAQTFASVHSDTSANARISLQASALPAATRDPVGHGIGSTGAGVRASANSESVYGNTDSGYLETLRSFGSVGGIVLLVAVLLASLDAYVRLRHADALVVAWASLLVTLPVTMVFGNALGLSTWLALAVVGRQDVVQRIGAPG